MNDTNITKLGLINTVLRSQLASEDKTLLVELLMRSDGDWYSWPSVQRLCQARGMKFEKNFKGADKYLPGLVVVEKKGRKNTYRLNAEGIAALEPAEVIIKHTPATTGEAPAQEGENNPSVADDVPAVAEKNPSEGGAYSTRDITKDSTSHSTRESTQVDADASTMTTSLTGDSLTSPSSSVTRDPSSCWDYQTSDRTRGSAAALEEKGHLVPSGGSIWDDEEVEW